MYLYEVKERSKYRFGIGLEAIWKRFGSGLEVAPMNSG
jgi:hypothetical protein